MNEPDLDELIGRPELRVDLLSPDVLVTPGEPVTLSLHVRNTSSVIEQLELQMVGVLPETVVQTPQQITLFPDEDVRVTLDVQFHPTMPAGVHEGAVVVTGRSGAVVAAELPLTVTVPEQTRIEVKGEPPIRAGGRRGTFEIVVDNVGNTETDLLLQAHDADRVLDLALSQRKVNLRVGQTAYATLVAYKRRPWTGSPVEHVITVEADGENVQEATELRFRQKAILTPGVITVLVLMLIVALWAAAMLFGVRAAMAPAEPAKVVPDAFMQGIGLHDLDPATSGGQVAGTITATSTGQPVPRVTVEVFDSQGELVTATASDDDGTYEAAGLVPARYRLRVRATGYEEQWWPGIEDATDAGELVVAAGSQLGDIDLQVTGRASSLGGQAITGDGEAFAITVEVTAVDLLHEEPAVITSTDEDGVWSVDGLTAPATYRITYTAAGYSPVVLTESVPAGDQVLLGEELLPAAPGSISGVVRSRDGTLIGGAEVTAQRGDDEASTTTPTSGEIGAFDLDDLPTPGTYLLTVSAEGYSSETQGVRLGPGQSVSDLTVTLSSATGAVRGTATSANGMPLGGVSVTISGGETVQQTETLTSGNVGSFSQSGLPIPGTYTVTFELDGYGRESVQTHLSGDTPEGVANVVMTSSSARITGRVVDSRGAPVPGAQVEVSDGEEARTTTTASSPANQRGRFNIGGLTPGSYTITATFDDATVTVLEMVNAAQSLDVTLKLDTS